MISPKNAGMLKTLRLLRIKYKLQKQSLMQCCLKPGGDGATETDQRQEFTAGRADYGRPQK